MKRETGAAFAYSGAAPATVAVFASGLLSLKFNFGKMLESRTEARRPALTLNAKTFFGVGEFAMYKRLTFIQNFRDGDVLTSGI